MRYLCLLLCILILPISIFSQKKNIQIDSAYQVLKNTPNSINKVDDLITLYKQSIRQKEINKSVLEDALTISKHIFYIKGIGTCYDRKGITARYEQDYSSSITNHKRALSYLTQTTDTLLILICLNNLGVTYRKVNLEKEAFNYYFEALKLSEKFRDNRSKSIALNGIGNVFIDTHQYDKALYYLRKGILLEKERNNNKGQEYGYANLGEIFIEKKLFDSAYFYIDKALKLAIKYPRKEGVAIKYTLFGKLYQRKEDYKKSNEYYIKSIPQLEKFKNTRYLSKSYLNIGINNLHLKKFEESKKCINAGLDKAKQINSKENILLGYETLTDYYSKTNQYKKALSAQKQVLAFRDSILNEASQKSFISTQISYESSKKDTRIQLLAKEKNKSDQKANSNFWLFIASVAIGITTILILILLRRNKLLELDQKNNEIKNYLLQIKKLKTSNSKDPSFSNKELKEFELSKREIEVLKHISNGLSNAQIAEKMFVSNNTIKTHISHIYTKLDVKNRVQAVQKISS
ncbi:response regulator transcription factor [Polaribacter sp. Z014]|uniref:response regulator transcription factor n=1 Tax=Polaribacter sp. Z014 TaxID=2927126 RepID=UPI0020204248|nr:response regulator transcription factor [Polaribacter sp. Z014]MCL7764343.1 response regulator transcription factor [Polaribacter sp. Z014]